MFTDLFNRYHWQEVTESIAAKNTGDVMRALKKERRDTEDFKALISPAAAGFLEEMAQLSHRTTQKRFGRTIQLYLPLYLSNECQ